MISSLKRWLPAWILQYGNTPVVIAATLYYLAVPVFIYLFWTGIDLASSSTAAIGYIFVVPFSAIFASPFLLVGFTAGFLPQAAKARTPKLLGIAALGVVISISYVVYLGTIVQEELMRGRLIATIDRLEVSDAAALQVFMDSDEFRLNGFALAAVAMNAAATPELLERMASIDDPSLYQGYRGNTELRGRNLKRHAVIDLLLKHPNVAAVTLERLSRKPDVYVLRGVADHPNSDAATLERLSSSQDVYVLRSIARHPHTPLLATQHIFDSYRRHPDAGIIEYGLAQNPVLPVTMLQELAATSKSTHTLMALSENPGASDEVKRLALARIGELQHSEN